MPATSAVLIAFFSSFLAAAINSTKEVNKAAGTRHYAANLLKCLWYSWWQTQKKFYDISLLINTFNNKWPFSWRPYFNFTKFVRYWNFRVSLSVLVLHKLAQTCTNLHKLAQTCTNLHKLAQTCTNLHKLAQTCKNMHKLAQTCTNLHKFAQICTNLKSSKPKNRKHELKWNKNDNPLSYSIMNFCWL